MNLVTLHLEDRAGKVWQSTVDTFVSGVMVLGVYEWIEGPDGQMYRRCGREMTDGQTTALRFRA